MSNLQTLNQLVENYFKLTGEVSLTKRTAVKLLLQAQPIIKDETYRRVKKSLPYFRYYILEKVNSASLYKLGELVDFGYNMAVVEWFIDSGGKYEKSITEVISPLESKFLYLIEGKRYQEVFEQLHT